MGCSAQAASLLSSRPEAQLPISSHRQRGRAQLTFSNVKRDKKKISPYLLQGTAHIHCPSHFWKPNPTSQLSTNSHFHL